MKRTALALAALAWLLAACEFSLAGDVTPPPDAVISSQRTPSPIEYPSDTPDAAAGAVIYDQSCLACHGPGGLGDGDQANQLPFFPAAIGDPDLARQASPEDWFRIVTEGRLTRYMPPFAGSLTPQQRWDVLAYVYSLSLDEDVVERGGELYVQHQQEVDQLFVDVHPLAAELDLVETLGFAPHDTEALTAYLQAIAFGFEQDIIVETTPDVTQSTLAAPEEVASFSGRVVFGSEGELPSGLEVTLSGYDHTEQAYTQTLPLSLGADGVFTFEGVPLAQGRIYFAQVEYQGQIYFSEFINAEGATNTFELPIIIYETTSDTADLAVEGVQLVFDFTAEGNLRVVQSVTISNLGDRAVVPADGAPVLHYSLPPGATNLVFQEGSVGDRYIPEDAGFGDLRAVLPGQGSYQLLFAYELPYSGGLTYQIYIDLPTRSLLALLPEDLQMDSIDFTAAGSQQLEARTYSVYTSPAHSAGETVTVSLRGAGAGAGALPSALRDPSLLTGIVALMAAVGLAWLWVRRGAPSRSAILDEIVALDERYERSQVTEAAYRKRRAALKAQLSSLPKAKR